jgi:hypothetical protein
MSIFVVKPAALIKAWTFRKHTFVVDHHVFVLACEKVIVWLTLPAKVSKDVATY